MNWCLLNAQNGSIPTNPEERMESWEHHVRLKNESIYKIYNGGLSVQSSRAEGLKQWPVHRAIHLLSMLEQVREYLFLRMET